MTPIIHCRMCLWPVKPVLDLGMSPVANAFADQPDQYGMRYPLGLSQCTHCDHVQIGFNVPGETLYTDYKYRTPEAQKPALKKYAEDLAHRYPELCGHDKAVALEIGSNSGLFVDALRSAGIWAVGVDPCANNGLPKWFTSKTARQMAAMLGRMDLIVANNTFAHVDDLRNMLLGVHYLLSEKGTLVFQVQYLHDLIAGGMFDMIYHEHKDYHQLKTWPYLLAKFGMVITGHEWIPDHGGSIRVHVKRGKEGVTLPQEPSIDWAAFKNRIENEKARMRAMVVGKGRVVVFGATAKATTLLHTFGLTKDIAYCVDETPQKIGKYLPGTSIQISHPDRMKDEAPDAMLLSAWNYADLLRDRFKIPMIVPFTGSQPKERKAA